MGLELFPNLGRRGDFDEIVANFESAPRNYKIECIDNDELSFMNAENWLKGDAPMRSLYQKKIIGNENSEKIWQLSGVFKSQDRGQYYVYKILIPKAISRDFTDSLSGINVFQKKNNLGQKWFTAKDGYGDYQKISIFLPAGKGNAEDVENKKIIYETIPAKLNILIESKNSV